MTEPGGGRLHVRVGQPGVQREQRHLDGEGDEEGQEQQHLLAAARTCSRPLASMLRISVV